MLIPGRALSIATFPGVIVHQFALYFFCRLRKVEVYQVCYFRMGDPVGYVLHQKITTFSSSLVVVMGPFVVNTLLCLLLCLPAYMPIGYFGIATPLSLFLLWLGVSIGMHAIPTHDDAHLLFEQALADYKEQYFLAVITFPLVNIIYLINLFRFVWADLWYGMLIGVGIPKLLFG
jgi:hypothetical protein